MSNDNGEEAQISGTENLQDDSSISVIEQSPMKQMVGTTENTSVSFTTDPPVLEIAESPSPSSMSHEDSMVSNSTMICEADTVITPSRLDDDSLKDVDIMTEDSISSTQRTFTNYTPSTMDSVKTNKLAVYAYKQSSERSYLSMISGYHKTSFSDNSNSSSDSLLGNNTTLSRKLTISEGVTCPVKRKKPKPFTSTPSTQQELLVQKMPDEISSVDVCNVVDSTVSQPIKKVMCL